MSVSTALARLRALASGCTSVVIKSVPNTPKENIDPLPMAIVRIESLTGHVENTALYLLVTAVVEFHFSRVNIKQSYEQSDAIFVEYMQRLGGDPTLGGAVSTVELSRAQPVQANAGVTEWQDTTTRVVQFLVTFKSVVETLTT